MIFIVGSSFTFQLNNKNPLNKGFFNKNEYIIYCIRKIDNKLEYIFVNKKDPTNKIYKSFSNTSEADDFIGLISNMNNEILNLRKKASLDN